MPYGLLTDLKSKIGLNLKNKPTCQWYITPFYINGPILHACMNSINSHSTDCHKGHVLLKRSILVASTHITFCFNDILATKYCFFYNSI